MLATMRILSGTRRALALATLPLLALTQPAAAAERTVVKRYAGAPASVGVVFCGNPRAGADGVGRVCHNLAADDARLDVTIADTSGVPVAGRVLFFGRATGLGEPLDIVGTAYFCAAVTDVAVPAAATHLDIEVGDRFDQPQRPCGPPTVGTYGTVTTVFR